MDDADKSDIVTQLILDAQIENTANSEININGSGFCAYEDCSRRVDARMINGKMITPRWCNAECRDAC